MCFCTVTLQPLACAFGCHGVWICVLLDGRINRRNVGKKKVKVSLAELRHLDPLLADEIESLSAKLGYELE